MCSSAQIGVWRVQWEVLEGGLKGLAGPRIEAARPLMEAPHLGGMEEEGDQTTEVD